ncbi:hypothetical protein SDC9_151762 [bioreactor metagenome]|uniref:Uncharacterized protein n=1 Tax=bioreactor metagenome TaxID=1076179 RepID=A0A645ER81_9ZZZZ
MHGLSQLDRVHGHSCSGAAAYSGIIHSGYPAVFTIVSRQLSELFKFFCQRNLNRLPFFINAEQRDLSPSSFCYKYFHPGFCIIHVYGFYCFYRFFDICAAPSVSMLKEIPSRRCQPAYRSYAAVWKLLSSCRMFGKQACNVVIQYYRLINQFPQMFCEQTAACAAAANSHLFVFHAVYYRRLTYF